MSTAAGELGESFPVCSSNIKIKDAGLFGEGKPVGTLR
jgi:hypothetical protein